LGYSSFIAHRLDSILEKLVTGFLFTALVFTTQGSYFIGDSFQGSEISNVCTNILRGIQLDPSINTPYLSSSCLPDDESFPTYSNVNDDSALVYTCQFIYLESSSGLYYANFYNDETDTIVGNYILTICKQDDGSYSPCWILKSKNKAIWTLTNILNSFLKSNFLKLLSVLF
jgi:hypothetical protein